MKIKYCLPIIKYSKEEVLTAVAAYRDEYQYLEIWLDPIKDIDIQFVDRLIYMLREKLILLFHRGDKIKTQLSGAQKKEILDLLDNSISLIDLDLSEKEELEYIRKLKVQTIISYHNYKKTPDDLDEIVKQLNEHKPTIYKISTMCDDEKDALKLLELQQILRRKGKKCIVLGMGKFGTITRVYGTLWSNEMIYAPVDKKEASALGQLTKNELETIFETLNK
ncbi:MAG TPA: type I 3-dehydroquinate dehydratase [Candidatus Saccharimonadales bacterium]|nr:type I 3-dehydroquinate dehydratase [Candidatus Saccharimonadales bacterium]